LWVPSVDDVEEKEADSQICGDFKIITVLGGAGALEKTGGTKGGEKINCCRNVGRQKGRKRSLEDDLRTHERELQQPKTIRTRTHREGRLTAAAGGPKYKSWILEATGRRRAPPFFGRRLYIQEETNHRTTKL